MGLNILADLQMLGLEYQHTGLAVSQTVIKTQPDIVRNILRAFVESIHFMKANRRESIAVLAKYLKSDDMEALDEAYDSVLQSLIPEKPYPTIKGIQIMLREMGIKEPAARTARPEQFVDFSFIKELDSSGFIDRLYKTTAVAKAAPRVDTAHPIPAAGESIASLEVKRKVVAAEEVAALSPKSSVQEKSAVPATLPRAKPPQRLSNTPFVSATPSANWQNASITQPQNGKRSSKLTGISSKTPTTFTWG